jgi:hypothetical protein
MPTDKVKHSKYILVEHKGKEWVLDTRNPFLVGEVYAGPTAGQISFDLWPQKVVHELSEQEIDELTTDENDSDEILTQAK